MRFLERAAAGLVVAAMAAALLAPTGAASAADGNQVLRARLDNGMRVVIVRDPLAPVVTTVMNYEVGSDDQSIAGQAHAQEHMMFRGSKTLSASQFADVTAITGGTFDADTQNKITQFYYVMPSQYLGIALHLEAARAQGLLDSQKEWNQERKAIVQEVTRDNSNADYRLYAKINAHLMAGTPYANNGLGTVNAFEHRINAPQLQSFYRAWYHPNNAVYVITGNVDPRATLAKVKALFGSIPSAALPAREPVRLAPPTPATFTDVSDDAYTLVMIGFRLPGYDSPDYAASQVLQDVLNSPRADLFGLVAAGKAFFAGIQGQPYGRAGVGLAYIGVPPSTKPQAAVATLEGVIDTYRKSGVPADLVEAAKRRELASAAYKQNSIAGLAFDWSQAVAVEGRTSPDEDTDAIAKVNVGAVNRVLREYLDTKTATVAYAVPKNAGTVGAGGGKAPENNTVIPTKHEPLPAWARDVLTHLQVPPQTTSPTAYTLPNGIKIVVQPESLTPTVVVKGVIRTDPGLQLPPGKDGVADLTAQLLPYGTTTYDRLQYQAQLDAIAADVNTGTDFSLQVLSKHFDRGMQLLADDELHPALKASDFRVVKAQAYQGIVGEATTPDYLAGIALSKALYPLGDPERRHATPASVKSLTLGDVKSWYASAYRPDLTTIVVVGDVTPEQAKQAVGRWFGGWKAEGATPNVEPSPVANNAPGAIVVPDTGRIQDKVSLTETLGLTRTDPDYAALNVANTVLGGGFYASVLYHDLREINGYVYYVGTSFDVGRTRSAFSVDYGAMPGNVLKAQSLIVRDLQHLQTTPLTEDRLERAKALILGEVPIRAQSYNGVAGQLLGYASLGLPLDQNLIDARAELAVTPAQLQAAMTKWVRPEGFVRLVIGPAPT